MPPVPQEDPAAPPNLEGSIAELKDWLLERVADDNDIVIDEMQEEFAPILDDEDEKNEHFARGSEEYRKNMEYLKTSIAEVKDPKNRLDFVSEGKQKITDGIRKCWYGGHKDTAGRPHGEGMLKYEDNKETFQGMFTHGVHNRTGKLHTAGSLNIEGTWKDSLMEGEMRVDTHAGWIEGYWKRGVPHGYQREFGHTDFNGKRTMLFVGRYFRGVRRGFCWRGCFGGGYICGYVDKEGEFSGEDLAYIYPDFKTALRGSFEKEHLVHAQLCELQGFSLERGMAVPRFSPPEGQAYSFEQPSLKRIALHPRLRDPWEEARVFVKDSLLPQGGEGLFAKRSFGRKELVCLFNGIRLRTATYAAQHMDDSDYRIRLNADVDLDIPHECIGMASYCATLGHKANHSNVPNAEWALVEHPRFGLIRGLNSIEAIAEGDEILINYQMNLADAPDWYQRVWLRHQREYKKMSDDSIRRVMARYAENTGKHIPLKVGEEGEFVVPEPKGVDVDKLAAEEEQEEASAIGAENEIQSEITKVKEMLKIKDGRQDKSTEDEPKFQEIIDLEE